MHGVTWCEQPQPQPQGESGSMSMSEEHGEEADLKEERRTMRRVRRSKEQC